MNEIFLDFVCQAWKHNSILSLTFVAWSNHLNSAVIKLLEGDKKNTKKKKSKLQKGIRGSWKIFFKYIKRRAQCCLFPNVRIKYDDTVLKKFAFSLQNHLEIVLGIIKIHTGTLKASMKNKLFESYQNLFLSSEPANHYETSSYTFWNHIAVNEFFVLFVSNVSTIPLRAL